MQGKNVVYAFDCSILHHARGSADPFFIRHFLGRLEKEPDRAWKGFGG